MTNFIVTRRGRRFTTNSTAPFDMAGAANIVGGAEPVASIMLQELGISDLVLKEDDGHLFLESVNG